MPQDRMQPSAALSLFFEGLALHAESVGMLLRQRSLWGPALVPLLLSVLAVLGTVTFVVVEADAIHGLVTGWMPVLAADAWYEWLWIGPARAGLVLAGALLFLVAAGILLVGALVVAGVLAAPFLDVLSARVERLVTGTVLEFSAGGLRGMVADGLRAAREELVRSAFFLGLQAGILFCGLVVPGGQVLAPIAMTGLSVLFLPLDYTSYTLDRRRFDFAAKRRFVFDRSPLMVGFGLGAFAVHLVPGLNLLAMPLLVVGGTLLALRHAPPPASTRAGEGGGGAAEGPGGAGPERQSLSSAPSGRPPDRARGSEPGSATSP